MPTAGNGHKRSKRISRVEADKAQIQKALDAERILPKPSQKKND